MPSLPFSLFSRPSQPSPPPPPRSPIPAPLTPPVPHQDDHRPAEEEEEPQQQPPHSPLSAPFSLRSHKLDDVRLASSLPFDSGGGGTMYDSFSTGERLLSPAIGSGGGEGGGGMPYFSAQGETLFGPSPGVSPLSEARASPSPRLVVRDGVRSDRERENLREKYGLPREKEEKLERLLAAVHRGKGTEGQTRMNEAGGGRREQTPAPATPARSPPLPTCSPRHDLSIFPDSPPATTSSGRRSRGLRGHATIESILEAAEASPPRPVAPPQQRSRPSTPLNSPQRLNGERSPTPSFSPRSARSPGTVDDGLSPRRPSTPRQTASRQTPPSSPISARSSRRPSFPPGSPPVDSTLFRTPPPASPPTPSFSPPPPPPSPHDRRALTPFPSTAPPPAADSNDEDHGPPFPSSSFTSAPPFRTLEWDYLPSRSDRRFANHRVILDGEMDEEEREWAERTRRVRNDGGLVDWYGNPVGLQGTWGRAILSPILTETEPTHTSPPTSIFRSPALSSSRQRYRPFAASSSLPPRPLRAASVPLPASPRLTSTPPIPSFDFVSPRLPQSIAPSHASPFPTAAADGRRFVDSPTSFSRSPPLDDSTRARALSDWASKVSPEVDEGVGASRKGPSAAKAREWERSGIRAELPENVEPYTDPVGMGSHRTRSSRCPRSPTPAERRTHAQPDFLPSPPTPPSPSIPTQLPIPSNRDQPSVDLPHPDAPRPPASGRSPEDIARWARESTRATGDPERLASQLGDGDGDRETEVSSTRSRRGTRVPSTASSPIVPGEGGRREAPPTTFTALEDRASPSWESSHARSQGPDLTGDRGLALDALSASSSPPPLPSFPSSPRSARRPLPSFFSSPAPPPLIVTQSRMNGFSPRRNPLLASPRPAPDSIHPSVGEEWDSPEHSALVDRDGLPLLGSSTRSPVDAPSPPSFSYSPSAAFDDERQHDINRSPRPGRRPYRSGPFPVPELTEEERAERRALRKTGRSPEFELPMEETKSAKRKEAWVAQQQFDKDKTRLLRELQQVREQQDDPAAEIPLLNALGKTYLGTSVPASRKMGREMLLQSLTLNEAQPEIAHLLANALEETNPPLALFYHHLAVRHAPHNPEYRLSLAFALSRSSHPTDLDASLDAFFNLHRDFPSSPYGVIGLVHLGRLYYERGRPEERAHVGEALRTALEALARLRLVPPEEREGGRWDELDELERYVIQRLREMDLGQQARSPVLAEPTTAEPSLKSQRRRPPSTTSTAPPLEPSRTPAASPPPAQLPSFRRPWPVLEGSVRSVKPSPTAEKPASFIKNRHGPPPGTSSKPLAAAARPRRRSRFEQLTNIVSALDALIVAREVNSAASVHSASKFADQIEALLGSIRQSNDDEAKEEEELRRALGGLEGEIRTLPERLVAAAKLVSARDQAASQLRPNTPLPPPPYQSDYLAEIAEKLRRVRSRVGREV